MAEVPEIVVGVSLFLATATATEEREDWLESIGEVVGVPPDTINLFNIIVKSGTTSNHEIESFIEEYRAEKIAEKEELGRMGAHIEAALLAIETEEESNKPYFQLNEQPAGNSGVVLPPLLANDSPPQRRKRKMEHCSLPTNTSKTHNGDRFDTTTNNNNKNSNTRQGI